MTALCKLGLLALIATFLVVGISTTCPKRCMCDKKNVRCMHLQMENIPLVPPNASVLDFRFNKIRDIPPGAFSNLKQLTTLLLNNNQLVILREGAFDGLENLKYLYIFKNRIHHIDDGAFDGLDNLKHLYLHFNNLETVSEDVFSHLQSLERLFLHNNKIKKILPGTFDGLPKLKRLRLDSNALVCDCSITWLMKILDDSKAIEAAATCASPENMKGLSIMTMDKKELHCVEPSIESGPKDVEVNFGGTAIFSCQVNGDPIPEIIWIKDSNDIPYSDPRYQIMDDGSLKIENPNEDDYGVFECVAKSPLGEIKSNEAKIIFQNSEEYEGPPKFSIIPKDKMLKTEERTLELQCLAKGIPRPYVSWFHNNQRLLLSERIKFINRGTLIINNINTEDFGEYRCEAENIHGKIFAIANVQTPAPPELTIIKEPTSHKYGENLSLLCKTFGYPNPIVTWYKNGIILQPNFKLSINLQKVHIKSLDESDSGIYLCRAENSQGFKEKDINVKVTKYTVVAPYLVYKPFAIEALQGSKIELPCKGEGNPKPTISWKKDGTNLFLTDRHKVSHIGSLYIENITQQDTGRYECSAINENGRATASAVITVMDESVNRPGDRFVKIAFAEAMRDVDLAINKTVGSLFESNNSRPNMGDLYRIIRYPNAADRELARASEIYERTLVNIRRHVNEGKTVNLTSDFSYKELLSPEHSNLVAKLSGCISHRRIRNCTNMCFHSKYRSIDGTCNNLNNPTWGASNTGFRRLLKPIYENGFSQPVGWNKNVKYNGYYLPSSRLVSTRMITTNETTPDSRVSHMVMQWGQFLDHDLDHATPSVSSQSWDGIDCKRSCDYAAPCFPIDIPKGDTRVGNRRCMDFIRSSSVCGSGMTSVFFNEIQYREQINQLTSFIDGSQVYGFAENVAQELRNLTTDDGLMRNGAIFPGKKALLPYSSGAHEMDCRKGALEDNIKCFAAGDIRANEQVGLLAMHTIWMREHNRIAAELRHLNPHWNGDVIYHETRKIVGAEMQHITYEHWLPIILGPLGMEKLGTYKKYDSSLNPTIANVFATAALRFGHSLINPTLQRLDNNFNEIPEGHLPLHKAFFASWRVVEEGGVDPLLRGLFTFPAKLKTPGQNLNSELTEKLFHVAHAVALDLAAMNIQRSRDHAIPSYTKWREFCNMSKPNSFQDLQNEISSTEVIRKLEKLYGSVDNIDVWVGGILEDQIDGGKVGPLFQCLLIDQFRRLRDGDRFWYENSNVFKPEQLLQIKKVTLGRVLCSNGDNIDKVTRNVFMLPETQEGFLECNHIQEMDLRLWADCSDCEGGFCSTVSPTNTRNRRSLYTNSLNDHDDKLDNIDRSLDSNFYDNSDIKRENLKTLDDYFTVISKLNEEIYTMQTHLRKQGKKLDKLEKDCPCKKTKTPNP